MPGYNKMTAEEKRKIAEATRDALLKSTEARIQDPAAAKKISSTKGPVRSSSTEVKAPSRQGYIESDSSLEKRLKAVDLNALPAKRGEPAPSARESSIDPKQQQQASKKPASRSSSVSSTDLPFAERFDIDQLNQAAANLPQQAQFGARVQKMSHLVDEYDKITDRKVAERKADAAFAEYIKGNEEARAKYGEGTRGATGLGQIAVDQDAARRPPPTFAGPGLSQLAADMERAEARKTVIQGEQTRQSSSDELSGTGYEGGRSEVSGYESDIVDAAKDRTRWEDPRRKRHQRNAITPSDSEASLTRMTPAESGAKSGGKAGETTSSKVGGSSGGR